MKVIREQLIEAAKTYTDFNQNVTYQPSMRRQILLVCLFYYFFETVNLRIYCGYFLAICQLCWNLTFILTIFSCLRSGLFLLFYFVIKIFVKTYGVMITSILLLDLSLMKWQLKCVRDVIFHSQPSKFLLIRLINFWVTRDIPHSQK